MWYKQGSHGSLKSLEFILATETLEVTWIFLVKTFNPSLNISYFGLI